MDSYSRKFIALDPAWATDDILQAILAVSLVLRLIGTPSHQGVYRYYLRVPKHQTFIIKRPDAMQITFDYS
jgi:hypothetical protein